MAEFHTEIEGQGTKTLHVFFLLSPETYQIEIWTELCIETQSRFTMGEYNIAQRLKLNSKYESVGNS